MIKYLRNPEVKTLAMKLFALLMILTILTINLFNMEMNKLNKQYITQNTLIVGNILYKNPELESEVIEAISLKNKSNYDLGHKVLSKYSYNENLKVYKNPSLDKFQNTIIIKVLTIMYIFIALIFIIIFVEFIGFYKKIEDFTKAAEEVVEGSFNKVFEYNKEGEFYLFSHQFNLMSHRVKESMDKLKEEKIFLKNIISNISHQLKTPLSSLIMFNELMKNDNMLEEDRKKFLDISGEQLRRMEWLIINLLKIGRLEAGVIEFKVKSNPLYVTINKALAGLLQKAKEKNQNIEVQVYENTYFNHDMEWTAEAFSNIIKNAIEHTPKGGNIIIKSEESPLAVSIFISDDGEGIPKEVLGKIFKRFYKGENSTNPTSIGIGLSLSKTIIESQNGSIRVESKVGQGTRFIITFLKKII